jgi:hypothetical protein
VQLFPFFENLAIWPVKQVKQKLSIEFSALLFKYKILNLILMDAILYPLAASKMLKHCEIFLSTMKAMDNEELVELAFNEFVTSSDRTISYLHKEMNKIGGAAPTWFINKRDKLFNRSLFYALRHIIAHNYFIPLTPVFVVQENVPEKDVQVNEYRLDIEMLPKDKKFDKKRNGFIKKFGPSVDAILLCCAYFKELSVFISKAEKKYENKQHFLRNKVKSKFRVKNDLTLSHSERSY